MIRFSCMYCGQSVSAEDELVGKKIECPGCGHSVMVRRNQPRDALKSPIERSSNAEPNNAHFPEGKSKQEVARWLDSHTLTPKQKRRLAAKQTLSRSLARYDDLTLFALSFAFVLVLWINPNVRKDLFLVSIFLPRIGLFVALAQLGMVLCLFNMFVRHRKYEFEKWLMLLFAVLVTAGTGAYAGYNILKEGMRWLMVFPAWNIVNSLVLLSAFHAGFVNTSSITDERPGLFQVLVTVASITLLLMLCEHVFNLHWAVTYSIAVAYTMSLLGAIQHVFGKRPTAT